jgi:hypothetical protein
VRDDTGLVTVDEDHQRREGMYMIGEVATLRHAVTTIADLHAEVSGGSAAWNPGTPRARPRPGCRSANPSRRPTPLDIAIIGMEALFPGADRPRGVLGRDRRPAPTCRHRGSRPGAGTSTATTTPTPSPATPAARRRPSGAGSCRRIGFDPLGYGIPPASLAAIEPVQLLSLEVAARALADAGYAERAFDRERASVIFGTESGNELGGAYGVRAFLPATARRRSRPPWRNGCRR